ncbi:MAG TPA: hypothetical protein H9948_08790 [Candidatus Jeotgalibaca merdavium]|uniref:Uncharacterized protein n=1 Tax=Candidatus Jeotgalibaca merdavium TaxID=2838627 RepID=A0A9D2KYX0_9LACT|nr:hypothetical protein [Candidatus Jeotgalibaca merdavium]
MEENVDVWKEQKEKELETRINVLHFIDTVLTEEETKKNSAMVTAIAELLDKTKY